MRKFLKAVNNNNNNYDNNRDHLNDSTVNIDQNTGKSPGDLRRLALTQTPVNVGVKNSQRSKITIATTAANVSLRKNI